MRIDSLYKMRPKKVLCLLLLLILTSFTLAETRVLITYDTVDDHTGQIARWIAEGVESEPDTKLCVKRVQDTTHKDLLWADAIIVGSPVYNAGLTADVGTFLAEWPFDDSPLKNRVGAAFVASQGATAGSENTIFDILKTMMLFRMIVVGGEDWRSGFGVAYIVDSANEETLGFLEAQAKSLGVRCCRVAAATRKLRDR